MRLREAFDITPGDVVSFIGAGGKTALMVALGYELAETGLRVLATATRPIDEYELELMPQVVPLSAGTGEISAALNVHQFVFIYETIQSGKVYGVDPHDIPGLLDAVDSDVLLVEADSSDGHPLKAPYSDEPCIPSGTSLVVPVASLSAIGKPLNDTVVYNPDAIIDRYGFQRDAIIKSPWLAQVVRDETLGLFNVPTDVRTIAFLNRTPSRGYGRWRARLIAQLMLSSKRFNGVAMGAVRGTNPVYEVQRPVGAVVLAAGMSTRMGEPKVLLEWENGRTIIEHIVLQLIRARIDHIVVVTGHQSKQVKEVLKPLDVKVEYNRAYKTGEMLSSLKAGLRAMPNHISGALMVLGDQPRISPKVIYQVLSEYARSHNDLIIPSYKRQRGHPILLGRRYWPEMLSLSRYATPRDVINTHSERIKYINVDTDSVLRDVDTPFDYQQERQRAGLD